MKNFLLLSFSLLVFTHCGNNDLIGPQNRLTIVSGNNQVGNQFTLLPEPVVVQVNDDDGNPQSGVRIETIVTGGGGRILNDTFLTRENGSLEVHWELGSEYENRIEISILETTPFVLNAIAEYTYVVPENLEDSWTIVPLDTAGGSKETLFDGIDEIRTGRYTEIHSCVIIQGGNLVFDQYFPGHNSNGDYIEFDNQTVHEVQSAHKSYRSMLIGIAIDKGFISGVDAPVFNFFPTLTEYNNQGRENIILEHALTMSSGLNWHEWDIPYGQTGNSLMEMYENPSDEWPGFVLSRDLSNEPGTQFLYNSGLSLCLTHMVENASGMNIHSFAAQYFWQIVNGAPNTEFTFYGQWLPRDMAKLGQVYLNDGKWGDTQVVSKEWVDESLESRFYAGLFNSDYGYQWWLRELVSTSYNRYECFYANGNGGQYIIGIKELNMVVVFTGGNFNNTAGMTQPFDIMSRYILPAFES